MTTDPSETPASRPPAKAVQLRCTVLIDGTIVGKLRLSKGHKVSIAEPQAKALAALNPPAVRVEGV